MPSPAVVTGLFAMGEKLIDHWFPNADEADERKAELLKLLNKSENKWVESVASIITAEAKSEHWIVASWRPLTMLVFVTIIANNYILAPYINLFFGVQVTLDLPQNMWDLLKIGLGGYIVSRGGEKIAKTIKE